jgi:radical SAM superfamily enzyme YgiQ (UPF0313 family)
MLDLIILNVPGTTSVRPPAAAAILKSAVIKANFSCKTIDLNARFANQYRHHLNFDKLTGFFIGQYFDQLISDQAGELIMSWVEELISLKPRYIGISVFTYQTRKATELLCFFIRNLLPNTKIIIGGQGLLDGGINGARTWVDQLDNLNLLDHWVVSEGEQVILDILNNTAKKEVTASNFLQNERLDDLSLPDYSDYDFDLYEKKILPITGSRGCVRNCTFCDIHTHWKKFVWRSGKNIANEMITQSKKYNINNFEFTDSLVNGNQKEYKNMISTLAEYNSKSDAPITWSGQFIIRSKSAADEYMWETTARSGAIDLFIGIESGSESVRYHLGKNFSNSDIDHAMSLMARYNLSCTFLMLFGYPTETEKDFQDTLDMFHRYKKYANTVIKNIEFGSTLGILPNTPLEIKKDELGLILDPEYENFWESTKNPTLTFKERIRRRIVASQTAETLGYKFNQDRHKELLMNFWQLYKNKKQIIPIKNIRPEQTCT